MRFPCGPPLRNNLGMFPGSCFVLWDSAFGKLLGERLAQIGPRRRVGASAGSSLIRTNKQRLCYSKNTYLKDCPASTKASTTFHVAVDQKIALFIFPEQTLFRPLPSSLYQTSFQASYTPDGVIFVPRPPTSECLPPRSKPLPLRTRVTRHLLLMTGREQSTSTRRLSN